MGIKYFNINMIQIMKKNILPLLMAVVALCSCSDEDLGGFSGIKTGEVIDFGVSAVKTRANYTDEIDSKQVQWEAGDEVRIYYVYTNTTGNVEKTYADYIVTPVEKNEELGSLVAKDANNQLKWAKGSGHKFYAVYPADDEITIDEKGVATFPINRDQKCTIRTPNEKEVKNNYTYVAEPDDKNIYMVASATAGPQSGSVWLDFKPIMTTINVVVKGPLNTTENQTTPNVVVTGVSLISTITTNTNASKSEFKYDITNGKITGSGSGTGTSTEQTETTFISVVNTDGLSAREMAKGETLVLTGFLPPMDTTTAEVLQRQVQIRVHTTGGNKTMTLANATALLPSAKGAIKLPSMYTPITGSNWITPLDDNIYVSQLSIPGTHDAATYSGTIGNLGQTQDYSIAQQWDMGIRAFDFRPALLGTVHITYKYPFYYFDNFEMYNWHGVTMTALSFEAGLNEIIKKMTPGSDTYNEGKDEFAIVIFKHEDEIGLKIEFKEGLRIKDNNTGDWQNEMQTILAKYKDKIVQFKPDLTISECRGKIIMLCRNWTPYTDTGLPTYGGYMDWSHHRAGSKDASIYGPDNNRGKLYVQDCFEGDEASLGDGETFLEVKAAAIKDFMNEAAKFHIDDNHKNTWMINHTSGYSDNTLISGTVNAYRDNAQYQNPRFYSYLTGQALTINGELIDEGDKPVGTVGIVMMDWVGTRKSGNYIVFGDLLPQAIIDNNYKYRMKRKGE